MSFSFEFSLEVLNHLGRGLYRNFATVVAEAISNSWDAEATKVHISIDKNKKEMIIKDNGKGMDKVDFQEKFLKVGYSRRNDKSNKSRRKILGRKGIGKLALLSIADKIAVVSKKVNLEETGGIINNRKLDDEIKKDGKYFLEDISGSPIFNENESGTYLKFEKIKDTVNAPDIIKKYLAVLFNFSISNKDEIFNIYVNEEQVSERHLEDLHNDTQFLWRINMEIKNSRLDSFSKLEETRNLKTKPFTNNKIQHIIKGYIASVYKPNQLKIYGTKGDFKAGLHLFSNGRLRQEDIFKDITSHRVVESYLYGEIHLDSFDEGEDIFTSSREGVIKDSSRYKEFLEKLKEIQRKVLNDWDKWRAKKNKEKVDEKKTLHGMKSEKKNAIEEFLKSKEDDSLKEKFREQFLPNFLPKKIEKQILISHSTKDKVLADKVEKELLNRNFDPAKILYTKSKNIQSKLPTDVDIFEYIKDFFIQDCYYNPLVIFVTSSDMEASWFASLEAGASWVTSTKHYITTAHNYTPLNPLHIKELYLKFDSKKNFEDPIDVKRVFDKIVNHFK